MAAKKKTAKKAATKPSAKKTAAKKAAKPAAKKAAKPAAKKVAKPAAKKAAKPAAKKAAKPAAKKAAKPAAKKAAKPAAKKAAKPAAKKVATPVAKKVEVKKVIVPVKLTAFATKQRQRLLELQDELVDAMSGVAGEIRNGPSGSEASGSGMHQGDAGSDAYDRDFALSVLAKEQDALYEIEQALRRIERGVYGICEMSGAKIPQTRLEAIPFARLTVDCQAKWEQENGSARFRPTAEIGFSSGNFGEGGDSASVSLDGGRV